MYLRAPFLCVFALVECTLPVWVFSVVVPAYIISSGGACTAICHNFHVNSELWVVCVNLWVVHMQVIPTD
jgi:hypothetical protein